ELGLSWRYTGEEPLPVCSNGPLVPNRTAGNGRTQRTGSKQPLRHAGGQLWAERDVHRHRCTIWRAEKQFLTVFSPARLAAAILGNLESLLSSGKRDHPYLIGSTRFVGSVGKPFPIVRKLGFILVKRTLHHREGFFVAEQRKNPDIFGAFRTLLVRDVPPVIGPGFDRLIILGGQQRCFIASPVGILDIDVRVSLPVRGERD